MCIRDRVKLINTLEVWKVRAIPARAHSCGSRLVVSVSPTKICPRDGLRIPLSRLKNEVLPAPFGPIIPKVSFGATSNVIPSRILAPPMLRERSLTLNADFTIATPLLLMAKNIENPGAFLHRGSFNLYVLYYLPTPEIVFKSVGT